MTDILQRHTASTQHGMVIILSKRLLAQKKTNSSYKANVSSGYLYQASFPQVKFQMPAPNANKQCVLIYKQQYVYFVTSNDSGLICHLA